MSRCRPYNIEVGLVGDTTYVYAAKLPGARNQPEQTDFLMTWLTNGPSGAAWAVEAALFSARLLREDLNRGAHRGLTFQKFPENLLTILAESVE